MEAIGKMSHDWKRAARARQELIRRALRERQAHAKSIDSALMALTQALRAVDEAGVWAEEARLGGGDWLGAAKAHLERARLEWVMRQAESPRVESDDDDVGVQ